MPQALRIFISSPGDVTPERQIAKRVIERLAREFVHHCRIEPILWERQPLVATEHFQAKITPPSETDIVVVILWSRLGSPLPEDEFPGPITGGQVTGTEWEFEDAVHSYRARKLPDLLLYRKHAPVMASLEDDEELERQRAQKRLVEDFVRRWLVDEDAGSFKAASHRFEDPVAFEEMLEMHLRELISNRIGDPSTSELSIRWHEGSPFRGLEPFEFKHAQIFFGRTQARNELREVLVRQSARGCAFVLVFGASGSGKSSLVKAGLLPDLMLPGMVHNVGLCRVATMKPSDFGGDLFAALAAALLRDEAAGTLKALPELAGLEYDPETLAAQLRISKNAALPIRQGLQAARETAQLTEHAEARLALVIDQLEELFTHDPDDEDHPDFVATLAALARSGLVWVIGTMRSDFFDRLATLPELTRISEGEGRYLLTPPNDAEIGQIVRQPAREAGLRFEERADGIPLDEQLREVASLDPGALPLLEFTLDQLWQQRTDDGMLTYAAYEELGGMEGALGKHAETVFSRQPEEVQAALPRVLRALVTMGQDAQASATARTVPLSSFPADTPRRRLVDAFLDPEARLFIADADGEGARVRVTHEALLRRWPRATEQIQSDRKDLQTRSRLEQDVSRWQQAAASDQASLLLPPGLPLSEAEALVERQRAELDPELVAYVDASSEARDERKRREREQERRAREQERHAREAAEQLAKEQARSARTFKRWFVGAAAIGVVAVGLAVMAVIATRDATRQTAIATATSARNLLPTRPIEGLLLALDAIHQSGSSVSTEDPLPRELRDSLFAAIQVARSGGMERNALLGHTDWVNAVAVSHDGEIIVTGAEDGTVRVWNAQGDPIGEPFRHEKDGVDTVAVSGDGQTIASGGGDGTVRLWNRQGTPLAVFEAHEDGTVSVAIARDGKTLVSGGEDATVRLWNRDGAIGKAFEGHTDKVMSVAFSPDEQTIVSGSDDDTLRLWKLDGTPIGAPFKGHTDDVNSVAFSPVDAEVIASASADRTVRVWNRQGVEIAEPFRGHENMVTSVAFSHDGRALLSGSEDRTLRLWDLEGALLRGLEGAPLAPPLRGHLGPVFSVAFHPDGKTLVSGSLDLTARLWDLREPFRGHRDEVSSVAVSPDGKTIVSSGEDETVRLWDLQGRAAGEPFAGHDGPVHSVAVSPDGQLIASGGEDKTVRLWKRQGSPIGEPFEGHEKAVDFVAFSLPKGQSIASASEDATVRLWNREGREIIRPLRHAEWVSAVAFSPDGESLATGSDDDTVRLWNRKGEQIGKPFTGHTDDVRSVAFDPKGETIVSGSSDRTLRLWNRQGQQIGKAFEGHLDVVRAVAFLPDGKTIVSAGEDKTVRLWDREGNPIGEPWIGHYDWVTALAVIPDTSSFVSASDDWTLRLWDASGDPQSWLREACERLRGHSVLRSESPAGALGQAVQSARELCIPLLDRSVGG